MKPYPYNFGIKTLSMQVAGLHWCYEIKFIDPVSYILASLAWYARSLNEMESGSRDFRIRFIHFRIWGKHPFKHFKDHVWFRPLFVYHSLT